MHRVNKGRYLLTHCNSGLMFLALLSAKLEVQVVLTSKSGKKQRDRDKYILTQGHPRNNFSDMETRHHGSSPRNLFNDKICS